MYYSQASGVADGAREFGVADPGMEVSGVSWDERMSGCTIAFRLGRLGLS